MFLHLCVLLCWKDNFYNSMNKCLQVNHCAYLTKTTGILDNNAASFLITVLFENNVNTINCV